MMANLENSEEDPRIILGNCNFSDSYFTLNETFIPPVENGLKSPIEKINSDLEEFNNLLLVGHLNARSVPKHISEIDRLLQETKLDVIGVSETFIKSHTPKSLCNIPGFKFIRKDRSEKAGGGIGVFVRPELAPKIIKLPQSVTQPEMLFIEITVKNNKVAVGVIYKPPKIPYGVFATIQESLAFVSTKYKHLIITGDFNTNYLKPDSFATSFFQMNVTEPFGLTQVVDKATRVTTTSSTLIDLLLVNNSENVKMCDVVDIPGISDHCFVYMAYALKKPKYKPKTITRRVFKHFNQEAFLNDIANAPWDNVYAVEENDLDSKATIFENYFVSIIEKHAPLKTFTVKHRKATWLTDDIKKHMDERDKQKNKFNNIKHKLKKLPDWTPEHHILKLQLNLADNNYKTLRNMVNKEVRNAKIKTFNSEVNDKINFAKQYHSSLKQHNIVESKFSEDTCNFDPNLLNQAFTANNNATIDNVKLNEEINHILENPKEPSFKFKPVTVVDIVKVVKSLGSNACGVDSISSQFIKLSINYIAPVITHIVNVSFKHNKFPDRWKHAIIKPIPKNDNPASATDFRPISLLPAISKIGEKIACSQMCNFFRVVHGLDNLQSAYKKFHSTSTALLNITDDIYKAMDKSQITLLVLLDYSKAFDCANHKLILAKLQSLGFHSDSLEWILSYLSDRKQKVKNDLGESDWIKLDNGVPQGSILGPLLFLVLVSDLHKCILNGSYHMYADDTQLYYHCKWSEISSVIDKINEDLQRIFNFSTRNCLKLNASKSYFIVIGSKPNLHKLKDLPLPPLTLNNKVIERKLTVKNLGVYFDENLTWNFHVNKMISTSYFKLRQAYRFKNFLSEKSKITICESYVLSTFNYCDLVYFNISDFLKTKIQKVQNTCVRFIFGLKKFDHISTYFSQLATLNMDERRTLHGCIQMHRISKNLAPSYLSEKVTQHVNIHDYDTRHKNDIVCEKIISSSRAHSFFPAASKLYNDLNKTADFRNTSITTFRKHAKKYVINLRPLT